jgi:hypothetical protein
MFMIGGNRLRCGLVLRCVPRVGSVIVWFIHLGITQSLISMSRYATCDQQGLDPDQFHRAGKYTTKFIHFEHSR